MSCGFQTEPTFICKLYAHFVKFDMPALTTGSVSFVPLACEIHKASIFCDEEITNSIPNNGI